MFVSFFLRRPSHVVDYEPQYTSHIMIVVRRSIYRDGLKYEGEPGHLVVGDVEADELLPDGGDHVGEAGGGGGRAGGRRGRLRGNGQNWSETEKEEDEEEKETEEEKEEETEDERNLQTRC